MALAPLVVDPLFVLLNLAVVWRLAQRGGLGCQLGGGTFARTGGGRFRSQPGASAAGGPPAGGLATRPRRGIRLAGAAGAADSPPSAASTCGSTGRPFTWSVPLR